MTIAKHGREWCQCLVAAWIALVSPLWGQDPVDQTLHPRGPYLQLVRPTSAVFRWRTTEPSTSRVEVGRIPGRPLTAVHKLAMTTEHEIEVDGLLPGTVYFYSVGSTMEILAGNDTDHLFFTAPIVGSREPIRIWAIGDSGTNNTEFGGGEGAVRVRDAYQAFTRGAYTHVWLMLGDNAYESGRDYEYTFAVFETYHEILRQTALWPSIGNHDGLSSSSRLQTGPYYESFTLPTLGEAGGEPSMTEAFYSFDYSNIHFIALESDSLDRTSEGMMRPWLEADLAQNTQDWTIAYFHHPPYTRGSHNSDGEFSLTQMREHIIPVLEAGGVDLVLAGHSHAYERSYLMNGHYGLSRTLVGDMVLDCRSGNPDIDGSYVKTTSGSNAGRGTVYVVNGSSGGRFGFGALNHPIMHFSTLAPGSLIIDVDGLRLEAQFLRFDGEVVDRFVIEKTDDNIEVQPCVDYLRGDANLDSRVNVADASWILLRLFAGSRSLSCDAAGDTDRDGRLNVTDAVYLLRHLFEGGPPPPAPFPACGPHPDAGLTCAYYFVCQ